MKASARRDWSRRPAASRRAMALSTTSRRLPRPQVAGAGFGLRPQGWARRAVWRCESHRLRAQARASASSRDQNLNRAWASAGRPLELGAETFPAQRPPGRSGPRRPGFAGAYSSSARRRAAIAAARARSAWTLPVDPQVPQGVEHVTGH